MVTVPGFLLRRLYVKGSLRNSPQGFEFQLKNTLGAGYAHQVFPIQVDGAEVPLEQTVFALDGATVPFSAISKQRPFTLAMNRTITIFAQGPSLSPGPHRVAMSFVVQGFGALAFDFTDVVPKG